LVILEAWAAGAPVISSCTSGASAMILEGQNGWLFDLSQPAGFHAALDQALQQPERAAQYAAAGNRLVNTNYDTDVLAGRMKRLYEQVIEEKHALRHSA
jgi:phosphatidylinositol alpha-1,6-mannosyltransferase